MIIVGSPPPFPASVALAHIGEHLQQLGMLQNDVIGRRECHRLVASGHAHQSRANQHHAPRTGAPACASLRPGLRVVIKPAPWTSTGMKWVPSSPLAIATTGTAPAAPTSRRRARWLLMADSLTR